jgi:hypothetical protein
VIATVFVTIVSYAIAQTSAFVGVMILLALFVVLFARMRRAMYARMPDAG